VGQQVLTQTVAEAGTAEEAITEAIVDEAFLPFAPISAQPPAYSAAVTYAKGEVVKEGTTYYRSQQAGNIAHTPSADADFEWWSPVAETAIVLLQNPSFGGTPAIVTQSTYAQKPPASSAATATALQTVEPGTAVAVEVG
jgi:hypothetical protein